MCDPPGPATFLKSDYECLELGIPHTPQLSPPLCEATSRYPLGEHSCLFSSVRCNTRYPRRTDTYTTTKVRLSLFYQTTAVKDRQKNTQRTIGLAGIEEARVVKARAT